MQCLLAHCWVLLVINTRPTLSSASLTLYLSDPCCPPHLDILTSIKASHQIQNLLYKAQFYHCGHPCAPAPLFLFHSSTTSGLKTKTAQCTHLCSSPFLSSHISSASSSSSSSWSLYLHSTLNARTIESCTRSDSARAGSASSAKSTLSLTPERTSQANSWWEQTAQSNGLKLPYGVVFCRLWETIKYWEEGHKAWIKDMLTLEAARLVCNY